MQEDLPELAPEIPLHFRFHRFLVQSAAEKIIELGDGGLRGEVVAADRAGALQLAAGLIGAQQHRPLRALGADRDDGAVFKGAADNGQQRAAAHGDIPRTKGLDDDAPKALGHDGFKQLKLDAGEHLDDPDGHLLQPLQAHFPLRLRAQCALVIADQDTRLRQRRIIRRRKSDKVVCTVFRGAVAPQELPAEIEADLGGEPVCGDQKRGDEVVPSVAAHLAQRDLGAGQYHGLAQVFQHEGQRRGGICHGIRAVEDHKAVIGGVIVRDRRADGVPFLHRHVGGIQQRVHLHIVPCGHIRPPQLGDVLQRAAEIALARLVSLGAAHHADGAAGVDEQDLFHRSSSLPMLVQYTHCSMLFRSTQTLSLTAAPPRW